MYTSLKLEVDELTTPYLVLVTFTGVQCAYEIASRRVAYLSQYSTPKVLSGYDHWHIKTALLLEIHVFHGAIYKKIQAKSSMRAVSFSMRVDLHKEWS